MGTSTIAGKKPSSSARGSRTAYSPKLREMESENSTATGSPIRNAPRLESTQPPSSNHSCFRWGYWVLVLLGVTVFQTSPPGNCLFASNPNRNAEGVSLAHLLDRSASLIPDCWFHYTVDGKESSTDSPDESTRCSCWWGCSGRPSAYQIQNWLIERINNSLNKKVILLIQKYSDRHHICV